MNTQNQIFIRFMKELFFVCMELLLTGAVLLFIINSLYNLWGRFA